MLDEKVDVCVIVPLFNEVAELPGLLDHLQDQGFAEIIMVDGGSTDGCWQRLQKQQRDNLKVLSSEKGRAIQMNRGAAQANGKLLLFLHADSRLPEKAIEEIVTAQQQKRLWGRFNISFRETSSAMTIIAWFINLRSRLSGIATGDQAIFINRKLFETINGFQEIPLMEDIAISKQLKKYCVAYCSKEKVTTSARRWLDNGIIKTVLTMWWFRLAYFFGTSSQTLAEKYRDSR